MTNFEATSHPDKTAKFEGTMVPFLHGGLSLYTSGLIRALRGPAT
jgi:hypothetical protein